MLKQNPFSLYDFLGYFIPGSLLIYSVYLIHAFNTQTINLNEITDCFPLIDTTGIFLFVLLSYTCGHILSFLSSYTIEKFANWKYKYPSKYLLEKHANIPEDKKHKFFYKGETKDERWGNAWRIILCIIILPMVTIEVICSNLFKFKDVFRKPLDDFLVYSINKKTLELLNKLELDIKRYEKNPEIFDTHRIISHFTYDNSKNHQQRLTNYVSLYGFLRTLTFISNFIAYYYIVKFLLEINFYNSIDLHKILLIFLLLTLSYIFFMAFMKFYRRYTLEAFMVLVITDFSEKPVSESEKR